MAIVKTNSRYYAEIAAAIREKTGGAETYKPSQMAEAIRALDVVIGLPSGYEKLLYIESTGTQYIDTGFKPNQDTRVVLDFKLDVNTSEQTPMHARRGAGEDTYGLFLMGTAWTVDYGTIRTSFPASIPATERLLLDFNKSVVTLNGTALSLDSQTFSAPVNLAIFARNTNGTINNYAIGKIFSCQIYDNDVLVRDYVPVKNADGEAGLYDWVGRQFYGSNGTGAFVAGAKSVSLPDGYKQLACITSSGTQYIDTGFKPNQDTRIVLKTNLKVSASSAFLFGARTGNNQNAFAMNTNYSRYRLHYGTEVYDFPESVSYTDPFIMELDRNHGRMGDATCTFSADTFQAPVSLYLFTLNNNGSRGASSSASIYFCQIYDNDVLVRDYIPCKNPQDVVGLYDCVTKAFYGNAGSGVFTGG